MVRIEFETPVVTWLVPDRHDLGVRTIRDVQDGRAALWRYGIENLRVGQARDRRTWAEAFHMLVLAEQNPRPEIVARARGALVRAAAAAGALTCPDLLAVLVTRGLEFAP